VAESERSSRLLFSFRLEQCNVLEMQFMHCPGAALMLNLSSLQIEDYCGGSIF
jgi:hypothetical protein